MPRCKNCRIRGHICEATDPKNPERTVYRKPSGNGNDDSNNLENQLEAAVGYTRVPAISSASGGKSFGSYLIVDPTKASSSASRIARSWSAQRGSASPRHDEDDAQQSPDIAVNTDGPKTRKLMGGSGLQSLTIFLDVYLQQASVPRVTPFFRHGMRYVEEFQIPLQPDIPDLPPSLTIESCIKSYCSRIHPLFPVIDIDQLYIEVQRLKSTQEAHWTPAGRTELKRCLASSDAPTLACIYAVTSLGADETAFEGLSEIGTTYLKAAYCLYPHLVGLPYIASVQALVLLTIALRGRSKEGQGLQTLGQAIRIAHSIGLHRKIPLGRGRNNDS